MTEPRSASAPTLPAQSNISPLLVQRPGRWAEVGGDLTGLLSVDRGLDGVLAGVVAAHGGRLAVEAGDARLDYAGLWRVSGAVARWLGEAGVQPGDRVGVALDRSALLVAVLAGIVRAGCAYVPLDAAYPAARLAGMIADADVRVVIGPAGAVPDWAAGASWLVAGSDLLAAATGPGDLAEPPAASRIGADAAYVMFTSGSTGRPKGVVVADRGIVRLVRDTNYLRVEPDDRLLLLAPVSFDASTLEIWGALLNGACVVVAPPGRQDLGGIASLLRERQISVLWLTAPLFHLMVEEEPEALCGLRVLLAGGDALSVPHVRGFLALPERRGVLVNGYGPTEATTFSCCHVMDSWDEAAPDQGPDQGSGQTSGTTSGATSGTSVPLGRAIRHSTAHVLDDAGLPVAPGGAGELCVGGAGLAHGYAGQPRLTAARFVPDPTVRGGRLYRTGDGAVQQADGVILFQGRLDGQVKVRGHRIEPAEVEAALRTHPAVADAAVGASTGSGGHKRLAAWVAVRGGQDVSASALQAHLRGQLPAYMVPAVVVLLDRLPLTPNGKIDRKALPDPDRPAPDRPAPDQAPADQPQPEPEAQSVAEPEAAPSPGAPQGAPQGTPQGPRETILAAVWADVLRRDTIQRTDNFFDLGGDSILSIQMKGLLRKQGLEARIEALFTHPTLADFAATLEERAGGQGGGRAAPRSAPAPAPTVCRATALQVGMLVHGAREQGRGRYHDLVSYQCSGPFQERAFQRAVAAAGRRHPALRSRFDLEALPHPLQIVVADAVIPAGLEDFRDVGPVAAAARVRESDAAERLRDFDWTQAPLMRVTAQRLTETAWRLRFIFHHAILDGWSLSVLASEILEEMAADMAEQPLPERPPAPFLQAAVATAEATAAASPQTQAFWRDHLAGLPLQELADQLSSGAQTLQTAMTSGAVDPCRVVDIPITTLEAGRLRALARRCGVPLKTVAVTLHGLAQSSLAGGGDIVTGIVTHGRPEEEGVDRSLGLFLNTVPVRMDLTGLSAEAAVQKVRLLEEQVWPHRQMPYLELCRRLGVRDFLTATVNFTQFHLHQRLDSLPGLQVGERLVVEDAAIPLAAQVQVVGHRLSLSLHVRTDSFWHRRLGDIEAAYRQALARLCAPPVVSMTTNPPAVRGDIGTLLASAFNRHADKSALHINGQDWSYNQLDRASAVLAGHLTALGACPECRIAVCLPPGRELIVAICAIWRVGAAYVPLAAHYPDMRLRQQLDLTSPAILIADLADQQRLAALLKTQVPMIEPLAEEGQADAAPLTGWAEAPARALAYVIHTSGTTGTPKAVGIDRAALAAFAAALADRFGLSAQDTVLQFASPSFDASIWEIVAALTTGAKLAIVPHDDRANPEAAAAQARATQATHMLLPPTVLAWLEPSALPADATVVSGGEALPAAVAQRWAGQVRLFNAYGPTEATICATVSDQLTGVPGPVPIGRPLQGVLLSLCQDGTEPEGAAHSVPEVLAIGGELVGRGYLGDARRTAERFVPDPEVPGGRRYLTGDLVTLAEDGQYLCHGRNDRQVKVRGHRLELDEIEGALMACTGVRQGAVVVVPGVGDRPARLVATVVPSGAGLDRAALRKELAQRLVPAAMPDLIVVAESLPLSSAGKVDRGQLAAAQTSLDPSAQAVASESQAVEIAADVLAQSAEPPTAAVGSDPSAVSGPASGDVLTAILAVFAEVLGPEGLSPDSDFFGSGGDSLSAIALCARMKRDGMPVSIEELFSARKPQALAEIVASRQAAATASPGGTDELEPPAPFALLSAEDRARIPTEALEDAFPLSRMQAGMLFHWDYHRATSRYFDVVRYRLQCPFRMETLAAAYRALNQMHPVLRTGFDLARYSEPLQLIHREGTSGLELQDISHLSAPEQDQWLADWTNEVRQRPLDLSQSGLFQAALARLGPDTVALSLAFPHALADGWSISSLVVDWMELAAAEAGGLAKPAAPISRYATFVALERAARTSPNTQAFWSRRLDLASLDARPARLPRLAGRDAVQQPAHVPVPIARDLADRLMAATRTHGLAVKHVLLAAHLRVLADWTGRTVCATGVVTNGRLQALDGERIGGLFLNTLPLIQDINGLGTRELVSLLALLDREAMAHRRFPLSDMLAWLPEGRAPDTLFNFTHFRVLARLGQSGVTLSAVEGFEYADHALVCQAGLDARTGRPRMTLDVDLVELTSAQAEAIALDYARHLQGLVSDLEAAVPAVARMIPTDVGQAQIDPERVERRLEQLLSQAAKRQQDGTGTGQWTTGPVAGVIVDDLDLAAAVRIAAVRLGQVAHTVDTGGDAWRIVVTVAAAQPLTDQADIDWDAWDRADLLASPAPDRAHHQEPPAQTAGPGTQVRQLEQAAHAPAAPEVEARLCALWAEVLGTPVSRDDSFFDLGGDSILSIRLKAKAREAGLNFELDDLFTLQTVARLARTIDVTTAPQSQGARRGAFALLDASELAGLAES